MRTLTAPEPTVAPTDGDATHVICCRDDDLALCGADLSGHAMLGPNAPTTCRPCALADADEDAPCWKVCPKQLFDSIK